MKGRTVSLKKALSGVLVVPLLFAGLAFATPAGATPAPFPTCGTEDHSTITCGGYTIPMQNPPTAYAEGYAKNEGGTSLGGLTLQFQYYSGGSWHTFYTTGTFALGAGATSKSYAVLWPYGSDSVNVSLYEGGALLSNMF